MAWCAFAVVVIFSTFFTARFALGEGAFCDGPNVTLSIPLYCTDASCKETLQTCEDIDGPGYCTCTVLDGIVLRECWGCDNEGQMCPGGGAVCTLLVGADDYGESIECSCMEP